MGMGIDPEEIREAARRAQSGDTPQPSGGLPPDVPDNATPDPAAEAASRKESGPMADETKKLLENILSILEQGTDIQTFEEIRKIVREEVDSATQDLASRLAAIQRSFKAEIASLSTGISVAPAPVPATSVLPPAQPTLKGRMIEVFANCEADRVDSPVKAENFLERHFTDLHAQFPDVALDDFIEAATGGVEEAGLGDVFTSRMVRGTAADVFGSADLPALKPDKVKRSRGFKIRGTRGE